MRISWRRVAQVGVLALAGVFLAALVRSQWVTLQTYRWQLAPGWAILALVGLELAWLFELDTWRTILGSLGGRLSFPRAVPVWFLSNIVRYIPGNVWQFLGMAELAAEHGVPRLVTLTSIVLHQAISTAVGLALAAAYFAIAGEGEWFGRLRPFLWLMPLGVLALHPRVLERLLNWAMARLHRPPVAVTLTWGQVWLLCLRYVIVWLVMGLSFAAFVRALTPFQVAAWPYLIAAWAAAYVIGYLSLLTPSGLGVREGVMTLLLATVLPQGVAVIVSLGARLWMVAGELVGAAAAVLLWRRNRVTSDE